MPEGKLDPASRILNEEDLVLRMQDRGGLVYVFTNGCFDVLHRGHAEYLFRAKELGDRLIVAVNSDRRVAELKGPSRPYVCEDDRAFLIASLECVDYVIVFDDPTPERLLTVLRPDIHAKGGDYSLESLPEAAVVREYGGRVAILPLVDGRSTTGLVESIRGSR